MDLTILIWIQNHLVFEQLNGFFIFITNFWSDIFWGLPLVAFLLVKKETRLTGLTMLLSLTLCVLVVNLGLKPFVARPRPFTAYEINLLIPKPIDLSFPSGHSASAFAIVWAYFITQKDYWRWGLVVFALLISFSRLYLFVHYPTDVIAGIIIGILIAYFSKWLALKLIENSNFTDFFHE
ncbi:phosphatase PAP2 family protein [Acetobacterium bakii]|uniref:Phosphatase n=1 Tax=Acetobacterium bakii TaxID=52689 RepID=A0A0L6U342_9FIRM|nr:phosphatase PAP2 family protein [Acetobacterium bakii]KNZ42782.1 phosphatase [Acetobacterium bakii]